MRLSQRIGLASVAAAGLVVFVASPASAAGWHGSVHVVQPGGSIQAAVDAANPGDTIVLKKGHYDGGILISKDGITIKGAGKKTVLTDTGTNHCSDNGQEHSGICVLDPSMKNIISDVTIKDLKVTGFNGFGIVGFGTNKLTVKGVTATNNTEYGITEFGSTRGRFIGNFVSGSTAEAGLYVGDIADAGGTIVKDNVSNGSALGILIRHARNVNVVDNVFKNNCVGVALVNDDQPGGQGNTRVAGNVIMKNNRFCPAGEEAPPLQGTGVLILGGDHNKIADNKIIGNRGQLDLSGGVVLVPSDKGVPAANNKIVDNKIKNNRPADIVNHSGSDTNVFRDNSCKTSEPAGLC